MKINPLLFLAVEYPPTLYKDSCNEENPCFEFKDEQKKLGYTKKNISTDECEIFKAAHQTFLESKNNNSTKDIIEDDLIGIKTLSKQNNDTEFTENRVINILYAIGASGTGKSTRLFGKDGKDKKLRKGIIKSIAEDKSFIKRELAYCLFYGRHKGEGNVQYDEILSFFTTNKDKNVNLISFKQENSTDENLDDTFQSFYTKIMTNKLIKLDNTDDKIIKYLKGESDDLKLLGNDAENYSDTFRDILEKNNTIWEEIKTAAQLKERFTQYENYQRKITTIMPTKNNIASSRGHTCVVLRLTDRRNKVRYFPLYDMAGSENPVDVEDFFKGNEDITSNLYQLSRIENIKKLQESNINSLLELKDKIDTAEYNLTMLEELEDSDTSPKNLETKIVKEGLYINHTIATIVFAVLCVSKILKTSFKKNDYYKEVEEDGEGDGGEEGGEGKKKDQELDYEKIYSTYNNILNNVKKDLNEKAKITGYENDSIYTAGKINSDAILGYDVKTCGPRNMMGGENNFDFNNYLNSLLKGQYGGTGCKKYDLESDCKTKCGEEGLDCFTKLLFDQQNQGDQNNLYKSLNNQSTIWLQSLFCFFFWNDMTSSSTLKVLNKFSNSTKEDDKNKNALQFKELISGPNYNGFKATNLGLNIGNLIENDIIIDKSQKELYEKKYNAKLQVDNGGDDSKYKFVNYAFTITDEIKIEKDLIGIRQFNLNKSSKENFIKIGDNFKLNILNKKIEITKESKLKDLYNKDNEDDFKAELKNLILNSTIKIDNSIFEIIGYNKKITKFLQNENKNTKIGKSGIPEEEIETINEIMNFFDHSKYININNDSPQKIRYKSRDFWIYILTLWGNGTEFQKEIKDKSNMLWDLYLGIIMRNIKVNNILSDIKIQSGYYCEAFQDKKFNSEKLTKKIEDLQIHDGVYVDDQFEYIYDIKFGVSQNNCPNNKALTAQCKKFDDERNPPITNRFGDDGKISDRGKQKIENYNKIDALEYSLQNYQENNIINKKTYTKRKLIEKKHLEDIFKPDENKDTLINMMSNTDKTINLGNLIDILNLKHSLTKIGNLDNNISFKNQLERVYSNDCNIVQNIVLRLMTGQGVSNKKSGEETAQKLAETLSSAVDDINVNADYIE